MRVNLSIMVAQYNPPTGNFYWVHLEMNRWFLSVARGRRNHQFEFGFRIPWIALDNVRKQRVVAVAPHVRVARPAWSGKIAFWSIE